MTRDEAVALVRAAPFDGPLRRRVEEAMLPTVHLDLRPVGADELPPGASHV